MQVWTGPLYSSIKVTTHHEQTNNCKVEIFDKCYTHIFSSIPIFKRVEIETCYTPDRAGSWSTRKKVAMDNETKKDLYETLIYYRSH